MLLASGKMVFGNFTGFTRVNQPSRLQLAMLNESSRCASQYNEKTAREKPKLKVSSCGFTLLNKPP